MSSTNLVSNVGHVYKKYFEGLILTFYTIKFIFKGLFGTNKNIFRAKFFGHFNGPMKVWIIYYAIHGTTTICQFFNKLRQSIRVNFFESCKIEFVCFCLVRCHQIMASIDTTFEVTIVISTRLDRKRFENWSIGLIWPWSGYGNIKQWALWLVLIFCNFLVGRSSLYLFIHRMMKKCMLKYSFYIVSYNFFLILVSLRKIYHKN